MFVISLAETNDPLDQQGAVRHRVGPKDHSFQPKEITHSFLAVCKENNHFRGKTSNINVHLIVVAHLYWKSCKSTKLFCKDYALAVPHS